MVPVSSIILMAVGAVLGIGLPVFLACWFVKSYKGGWKTILVGAAVFVVFALVLESLVHQVVLKGPYGSTIMGNVWYYALYGGFMAALFEETGRLAAMKWVLKDQPSEARIGVGYGIGHGGAEMLILFGVTMISNLALSAMINAGQADTLLASAPAEAQELAKAQFANLQTMGASSVLIGIWERLSALILQLSLSVIMWTAVRRGGKWMRLFLVAFLIHFLVDAAAVLLNDMVSMLALEAIVFATAIVVGAIAWKLSQTKSLTCTNN